MSLPTCRGSFVGVQRGGRTIWTIALSQTLKQTKLCAIITILWFKNPFSLKKKNVVNKKNLQKTSKTSHVTLSCFRGRGSPGEIRRLRWRAGAACRLRWRMRIHWAVTNVFSVCCFHGNGKRRSPLCFNFLLRLTELKRRVVNRRAEADPRTPRAQPRGMLLSQRRTRCREITGPTPHSVAVVRGTPTKKQHHAFSTNGS